jgi:AcrR family transcriptional regulator
MDRRIEQGKGTRQALIETATRLFAARGYANTSIDAVLEESGVSRGALYHHFDGKEALFEAVLEATEARIAAQLAESGGGIEDPIEAMRQGAIAWLRLSRDPVIRQVTLLDAPSVVGWERWRAIDEKHGFGLLKGALEAAAATGRVERGSIEMIAHVLLAATLELALVIARSADPEAALREGAKALSDLIDGMVPGRPSPRRP